MGLMTFTAEAFARMQKALLPPGKLWRLAPDSFLSLVFLAAGDELERVSGRARDLVEEADPRTTTELAPDFERLLDVDEAATIAERRLVIVAQLTKRQRSRTEDIKQALAPYLGLDAADVQVIERDRADAIAIGDDREIYRFFVYRDPALAGTYDIAAAQVELDAISHSHVKGHVITSIGFIVDDADSLCDRDIIGV